MYEEYARAVQQAPGKAPRLRVFLFPGVEEALTPEQYQDGNAFFSEALENTWCEASLAPGRTCVLEATQLRLPASSKGMPACMLPAYAATVLASMADAGS